jgi:hypothetical protein
MKRSDEFPHIPYRSRKSGILLDTECGGKLHENVAWSG